jgi:hypothetical protein
MISGACFEKPRALPIVARRAFAVLVRIAPCSPSRKLPALANRPNERLQTEMSGGVLAANVSTSAMD